MSYLFSKQRFKTLFLVFVFSIFSKYCFAAFSDTSQSQEAKTGTSESKPFSVQAQDNVQLEKPIFLNGKTRLTGSAKYSEDEKTARLGIVSDDVFNSKLSAGADIFGRWEKENCYNLKGWGQDVYAGFALSPKAKVSLKLVNEDVSIYKIKPDAPAVIQNTRGLNSVRFISADYERLDLDNKFYPTKGSAYNLDWDLATKGLGSDCNFNRIDLQTRGYYTFWSWLTFVARTKIGWMEGFGKRDSLPYYELFFNGGTSTVRGYKARHLGPKDSNYNLPLGGDFLWVNNVELRAPVYKKLVAAVFFDFGGLWEKPADFAGSDLRSSAGLGFRYLTPWGILRLDYGWRLHHESNEAPSHIHATFGIPF